ncbi:MAG TPA: hypothetical protein ENK02_12790 [Planctomycetes bacterium]|nr:hypothetical protein [Planctomycetota bacterium]
MKHIIVTSLVSTFVFGAFEGVRAQDQILNIQNLSPEPRIEWIRASVPFPRGRTKDPSNLHVQGRPTHWRILQRWPDGSVRIAQAQFLEPLQGFASKQLKVVQGSFPVSPFKLHPAISKALPHFGIVTSVQDIQGRPYFARFLPLYQKDFEVLEASPAFISLRARHYHFTREAGGLGRDLLSQTVYMTLFSKMPIAVVDLVVANDYKGADNPPTNSPNDQALGDIGFQSVDLAVLGARALVRFSKKNLISPPLMDRFGTPSSWTRLLSKSYFGDGQGKRWRLILLFDDPSMSQGERTAWQGIAKSMEKSSVLPIADFASWQRSYALGLHGGPVRGPKNGRTLAIREYQSWKSKNHFGPFGGWGDLKESYVTGTPRNGPMTELIAHAAQTSLCLPLEQLEGEAWQQTLRPYHLWGLTVKENDDIYMIDGLPFHINGGRRTSQETLGRLGIFKADPWKAFRVGVPLDKNHGWNAYDLEHFSIDILYDYWILTGDHRTYDEIVNMSEAILAGTRNFKYFTGKEILAARAEGWVAQALVKAWLVTREPRYRDHILQRIHKIIEPKRRKDHPSRALVFQYSHDQTRFPRPHRFYMPWQHAAIVHGYMGVWRYFGDQTARRIAHDALFAVIYGWVRNFKDPKYGLVKDGLRYFVPVSYNKKPIPANYWDLTKGIGVRWGDNPLGGAHTFLVGAMDLIREDSPTPAEYLAATYIRNALTRDMRKDERWRWYRWTFLREHP